jgi:hypothetical protein
MNTDIKNIIELLKELEVSSGFNVFIPSLDKEIKFKQLTTEQLKQLLKTAINSPVYNTEFILTFNSIIKENCIDETVNTNALTVYDKLFILFSTKIVCISSDYTFSFTDEEFETYNLENDTEVISVKEHYDNFLNKKHIFSPVIYTQDNCTLHCNIPTIETENKLENELHKNNKITDITEDNIQAIIGDAFINEVTKFITKIVITGNEVDFNALSFKDRVLIIEKVPVQLINNVLKYIEDYKKITEELTTFTFKTDKGDFIEKQFPVDASFFNI